MPQTSDRGAHLNGLGLGEGNSCNHNACIPNGKSRMLELYSGTETEAGTMPFFFLKILLFHFSVTN